MCDENYVVEYQMTFHSLNVLCDLLRPYAQAKIKNWRNPIELHKVVVAVLKRLVSRHFILFSHKHQVDHLFTKLKFHQLHYLLEW
jgi:hypothetical protein